MKKQLSRFSKAITMSAAGIATSMLGVASALAGSGDSFVMTAPNVNSAQIATGGTGLLGFMATMISNHFVLLFQLLAVSLGVGLILMIVRSVFRIKHG